MIHSLPYEYRKPARKHEAEIVLLIDAAADAFEKAEVARGTARAIWYDQMTGEAEAKFTLAKLEAERRHRHAWQIGTMCGVQLVPEYEDGIYARYISC
jgi:dihydroxyacetone kinase